MPKKIDEELKARVVRLVSDHQGEYSSLTAAAAVVAKQLGAGKGRIQPVVATPRSRRCVVGARQWRSRAGGAAPAGGRRQWAADRALRPAMRSPGRPEPSRAVQRAFWRLIADGLASEAAGAEVGVSSPVASRWFRHAGGMSPTSCTRGRKPAQNSRA